MNRLTHLFIVAFPLILSIGCKKDRAHTIDPVIEEVPFVYQINLHTNTEIPIGSKVDIEMEVIVEDSIALYAVTAKRRGGFSISFPKYSYEIDLKEDIPLLELPADDDWILNANFIDKTFLRHTFSYDLFKSMHPNNDAVAYQYIELYMNDNYSGLYVLMEKLDKSSLDIDGNDESAYIFKEPPIFRNDIATFTPQDSDNFHQQTYPKISKVDKTSVIEAARRFIVETEDAEFNAGIGELFDINNIIDWHLLLLFTNNGDGILKNFYLYKKDVNTPIRIAPWDYDHSFGRDGDNELNMIRPLNINKSILFDRLLSLEWYRSALKQRWKALNDKKIFDPEQMKTQVELFENQFATAIERNFTKWKVDNEWYYDANDFTAEIEIFKTFIDIRHEQLALYFDEL